MRRRVGISGATWAAVAAALAGLAAAVLLVVRVPPPPPSGSTAPDERPSPTDPMTEDLRMPLTGVPTDAVPVRPAAIVKVSNSPEARPQTGLEQADVVVEEVTEGGVTRFLAVFHSQLPRVVGPVRSARPVDVQMLGGFGRPAFLFSGARPEVRDLLAGTQAVLLTEGDRGFFRDDGSYASHPVAPHDLFVRLEAALASATERGARPVPDPGWTFTDQPPPGGSAGARIDIDLSPQYRTTWTYDADERVYRRAQNGAPSTVTGPARIGAANVVVIESRHYVGASGYPETDLLGEGRAIVLRDGDRYAARWSKPRTDDALELLTADGAEPFPLAPGTSWLHLPRQLPS